MSIYKGTELLAGVATDTISNANYLLDFKWSDHIINSMEWLRADTFSWQNGDVYKAAYNHLVADYNGGTSQTETVGSYTITYVLADDGHKITTDETTVDNIYNESGVAWYYVLDTANTRFKLPRENPAREELIQVIRARGNGNNLGLYNGTNTYALITDSLDNLQAYGNAGGAAGSNYDGSSRPTSSKTIGITTDSTKSGIISDMTDSTSVYKGKKYLYCYVGQFSQSATEQTAGLNSELFNGKVDLNAANLSTAGKSLISGLGMPSSRYTDLTLLASGNTYTAPANGYYFLQKNGNANQFMEMTSSIKIRTHIPNYNGGNATIVLPVKKGTVVTISYDVSGSTTYFRFIYADGDS